MKLSDAIVERAAESMCNSIGPEFGAWRWDRTEDGEQHRVQWRIDARAALEAALSECITAQFGEPREMIGGAELHVWVNDASRVGQRVALVPLED